MALPPAQSASAALLNFQVQNQCTISLTPVSSTAACQPVAGMSVSENYLNAMLPTFEGDVPQYYNDSLCNCTAGVGHLVQRGQCPANLAAPGKQKTPQATNACVKNTWWKSPKAFPGASVSQAQIETWEEEDIAGAENMVRNALNGKKVTQQEFDALVDMAYNGGAYYFKIYKVWKNFTRHIQKQCKRYQVGPTSRKD
jgi:GH24 family phage-related lysozyme (muramidase)